MSDNEAVKKTPIKRSRQSVSFDAFRNTATQLGMQWGELAEAIGYSSSAPLKWEESKMMPTTAKLACEALVRRQGNTAKGATGYVVLKVEIINGSPAVEIVSTTSPQKINVGSSGFLAFEVQ